MRSVTVEHMASWADSNVYIAPPSLYVLMRSCHFLETELFASAVDESGVLEKNCRASETEKERTWTVSVRGRKQSVQ